MKLLHFYFLHFQRKFVGVLWLLFLATLIAYQIYIGWKFNSNDTTNIYLQIGRSSAYTLLILISLLWLPVLRKFQSGLNSHKWSLLLPLRQAKNVHKWLGHVLMVFALSHGAMYLFYFDSLEGDFIPILIAEEPDLVRSMKTTMYEFVTEDESIDVMQSWIDEGATKEAYKSTIAPLMKEDCTKCHNPDSTMTYAVTSIPLNTYEDVVSLSHSSYLSRQFKINISGIVMFVCFALVWFTSLAFMRKRKFKLYRSVHKLGYLIAILSLLHIARFEWLLAPCILLLVEFFMNRRITRNIPIKIEKITEQHIVLNVDIDEKINSQPGYYIQLRCKEFADKQWHDFSLTGLSNDRGQALIKIQRAGKWTSQLLDHNELTMDIRGPWASPIAYSKHKKSWLLIAGGIGITPIISLLRSFINNTHQPEQIKCVWVLKQASLLDWLKPILQPLFKGQKSNIKIFIYLTDKNPKAEFPSWLNALSEDYNIVLCYGRPDFDDLYQTMKFQHRPTIFSCGPKPLMESAKKAGMKLGWPAINESF